MLSSACLRLRVPGFRTKRLLTLEEDWCGHQSRPFDRPSATSFVSPAVASENSRGQWSFGVTISVDGALKLSPEVLVGLWGSETREDIMIQASSR